jgi:hypothetical protein
LSQCSQDLEQVCLVQFQGKEVLTHKNVIVS